MNICYFGFSLMSFANILKHSKAGLEKEHSIMFVIFLSYGFISF